MNLFRPVRDRYVVTRLDEEQCLILNPRPLVTRRKPTSVLVEPRNMGPPCSPAIARQYRLLHFQQCPSQFIQVSRETRLQQDRGLTH